MNLFRAIRQALCKHKWVAGEKHIDGANKGWLHFVECKKCGAFEALSFARERDLNMPEGVWMEIGGAKDG